MQHRCWQGAENPRCTCPSCGHSHRPKRAANLPPVNLIRKLLDYDLHTGIPTWRIGRYIGKVAGYVSGAGYRVVRIGGVGYYSHRLHWSHFHGRHPRKSFRIDHADGSPGNDAIQNLREVSPQQNAANMRRRSHRKHKGVYINKAGRFIATIGVRGRTRYLGSYNTENEAARAYLQAARKFFGTAARI
jgi:hypothetical protein